MRNLCMILPPFSPDYSGVCSALFDFNALIVIHDAAGCTGNYTGFDEPRWYGSRKAVYCSGLRKMDAIMGNEDKLVEKIKAVAKDNRFDFAAVVGSPVPMVMGTDFQGLAAEIERETEMPCFGFATTGTKYYNHGIAMAVIALLRRFAEPAGRQENAVNILGATPLDFTQSNMDQFIALLTDAGWEVKACLSMGGASLDQVRNSTKSAVNIAVSQSGVQIAEYMSEEFGIPYITGLPVGTANARRFLERLRFGETEQIAREVEGEADVLIVGDAVVSHSVKDALRHDFGETGVDVGVVFGTAGDPYAFDRELSCEQEIDAAVNDPKYRRIIADPLINALVREKRDRRCFDMAHYAVSSKLYAHGSVDYIAGDFNISYEKRGRVK